MAMQTAPAARSPGPAPAPAPDHLTGTVRGPWRMRAMRAAGLYTATFLILIVLNFFLPRMLPGDPIDAMQDPGATSFVENDALRQEMEAYYGLDKPLGEQFVSYLGHLARGDLGTSIGYNVPVSSVLWERLPWTLLLITAGFMLSAAVGILGGIHSAWRRGHASDRVLLATLIGVRNLPPFFVGSLLLLVFAVELSWFPLAGAQTPFAHMGPLDTAGDVLWHLTLPAITLATTLAGAQYLLMRNSMVAELGQDYLLLGRAKGLSERHLKYHYAARNALLPVITQMALQISLAITGTVFVETVFAYPGMGRLIFDAIGFRDYPVLAGCFLVLTLAVLIVNLILDFVYIRLDPRTEEVL